MSISSEINDIWGRLTYNLRTANGVLTLHHADVKGSRFLIGRSKACNLQIGIKMISAQHCYLTRSSNGHVQLCDTSTNGTYINNNKVNNGEYGDVEDGDKLYLVRKKLNPDQDFFLIFQATCLSTSSQPSGSSGIQTRSKGNDQCSSTPPNKKIKTEDKTVESVNVEPSDSQETDLEGAVDNMDDNITVSLVKVEVPNDDGPIDANDLAIEDQDLKPSTLLISDVSGSSPNKAAASGDHYMEEMFKCSLCLEILHDPVCVQPCMHCYCAGCFSEWMSYSSECPQCRCSVERLAKNHMISSILEAYMKNHPDKRRSLDDIKKLDEKNKITKDMLQVKGTGNQNCPLDCDCDVCLGASDDSVSDNSLRDSGALFTNFIGTLNTNLGGALHITREVCEQCPGSINNTIASSKQSQANDNVPGPSTAGQDVPFVCGPNQSHISCSCCYKRMPDRRNEANVKPQQCGLCRKVYCHMYLRCTKIGCLGCLNKFSDVKFGANDLSNIVSENTVETRILMDYGKANGMTTEELVQDCLNRLNSGEINLAVRLKSDSVLCYTCGLTNLKAVAYQYRKQLANNLLPAAVTSRPNCYWGSNCRTQKHNMSHAQRYNHICDQRRF